MNIFIKDPGAKLDYGFDYSDWLYEGDSITTSSWTVEPGGLDIDSEDHDSTSTVVWLSGGTAGRTYRVTNRITTAEPVSTGGRIDERSIEIRVRER